MVLLSANLRGWVTAGVAAAAKSAASFSELEPGSKIARSFSNFRNACDMSVASVAVEATLLCEARDCTDSRAANPSPDLFLHPRPLAQS